MSGGATALATGTRSSLLFDLKAHANWRAFTGAALIGSSVGLALGACFMAGGMARSAGDQARVSRVAQAAAGQFSEAALEQQAAGMDAGVLRVARRHDPFAFLGDASRDRQAALFADQLEDRAIAASGDTAVKLATSFARGPAAQPFRLGGPLENSRELECLTQAVYFEARGETPAGQAAVAQVVLNRVRHAAFPKTVCGVVYQGASRRAGCQFSFACDGSLRRGHEAEAWRRAQRVATRALSGAVAAGVGDATHFHTINVAPNWGPNLVRTAQVGLHVFYKFGRGVASTRYAAATEVQLTSAPPPAGPPIEAGKDLRLASAVTAEHAPAATDTPADAVAEVSVPKPVATQAEAGKLTPASAPRTPEAPVKAPV